MTTDISYSVDLRYKIVLYIFKSAENGIFFYTVRYKVLRFQISKSMKWNKLAVKMQWSRKTTEIRNFCLNAPVKNKSQHLIS